MKTFIRKFYESRFYLPGLFILYFILTGAFIYIIDYYPKGDIEELLKRWVPWNLRAGFLFLMIGVVICRRDIAGSITSLWKNEQADGGEKRQWNFKGPLLIVLVLSALIVTSFVAPRGHRIFYDEDIYASMGHIIALTGQTGMCHFGTQDYGEFNAIWLSYYKEPSGWPFLMSLVFQLFGTDELYGFFLNNLIFAAAVLVVFFMTRVLTGRYFPAFLAGLVYALIPHNLIWSNTIAVEPSAALFAGLVVLCLAVYLKSGRVRHLFMLAVVAPLACQMRPESGLILLLIMIMGTAHLFSHGAKHDEDRESAAHSEDGVSRGETEKVRNREKGMLFRKEILTAGLLGLFFLLPHLFHLYVMSGQSWGATGAKFSMEFFWNNLTVNGPYYLNNALFPALFTALALVGLVFARCDLKWRLMIFMWFLLFWGIFLFFYAGSYKYGADVRFALVTFMPIAVLAGMGGEKIGSWIEGFAENGLGLRGLMPAATNAETHADKAAATVREPGEGSGLGDPVRGNGKTVGILIVLVLIFTWLPFLPLVRTVGQEAWGARNDHYYAHEFIKKIPPRSIVLTHNAAMFLVWGRNAIQAYAGIQNPEIIRNLMENYQGHVYFHYSFWCNIPSDGNQQLCEAVMAKYNMEEIASASEQTYRYGLYKMIKE